MLYTHYVYFFEAAGLILLVAMIGAIVLTLQHKARRQAPEHRRAGGAHAGRPAIESRHRCGPGRAWGGSA